MYLSQFDHRQTNHLTISRHIHFSTSSKVLKVVENYACLEKQLLCAKSDFIPKNDGLGHPVNNINAV